MEENQAQQENPMDNSLETRKKKQMEQIEKVPLGTYWKKVNKNQSNGGPCIDEYCHITRLEFNQGSSYLQGERLQITEGSLYDFDDRASIYNFELDNSTNVYYEQITQDEYEGLRNKTIKIFENKRQEKANRYALFQGFHKETNFSYSYDELMKAILKRYNNIKEYIDEADQAEKLCKENGEVEFLEVIEKERKRLRDENLFRIYYSLKKHEQSNLFEFFNIVEIDITSVKFEPEKVNEHGVGYVGGTPFENNGLNFHYKSRSYGQNLSYENYNRDYYKTSLRVSFNGEGKTWREDDPKGWITYIAINDKYTQGKYNSSPSYGSDEFYFLNKWHFEQLLDLIRYTGLDE